MCGVSTQLQQQVAFFDEVLLPNEDDFAESGLKAASVVRLGFLAVVPGRDVLGVLGYLRSERHRRLLERLSRHLQP